MIDRLEPSGRNESEILATATPGQRLLYTLQVVDAEINSEGLMGLFWNASGGFVEDAIRYADDLGATRHAELLRDAASIFPGGGSVPPDIDERQEVLDSREEEAAAKFDAVEGHWFGENLTFEPYVREYIAAHPDEFFDGSE